MYVPLFFLFFLTIIYQIRHVFLMLWVYLSLTLIIDIFCQYVRSLRHDTCTVLFFSLSSVNLALFFKQIIDTFLLDPHSCF